MQKLLEIFSTREISIIFWLIIIIIFSIIRAGKSLLDVLKAFFSNKLFAAFLSLTIYSVAVIFFLNKTIFWDISLLKDSIIWFISSAMILFFNINKARNTNYFRIILIDNFKATLIIEFLLNFYTFNLLIEMIIIPIISILIILKLFAENSSKTKPEHKKVVTCLSYFINLFGIFIFLFTSYKTFFDYSKLVEISSIKSFLLPIILTTIVIPYFYFLALFINYETIFIRIRFMFQDKKRKNNVKKYILFYANFSLNKLERISNGLNKFDIYHSEELKKYIKELSQQTRS